MWIDIEAESSHISLLPPNSHRPQKCLGCSDMFHKDGATMLVHVSRHSFKSHNQTHIHDEIKHHWILDKEAQNNKQFYIVQMIMTKCGSVVSV